MICYVSMYTMYYDTPLWGSTPVWISIGSEEPLLGSSILTSLSIQLACCLFSLKPVIRVCALEPTSVRYAWQDPFILIIWCALRVHWNPAPFVFHTYSHYPQLSTLVPLIGHPVGVLDTHVDYVPTGIGWGDGQWGGDNMYTSPPNYYRLNGCRRC